MAKADKFLFAWTLTPLQVTDKLTLVTLDTKESALVEIVMRILTGF